MLSKILNVIICYFFIQWALQFIHIPNNSSILDTFFILSIFILALILFYEHNIKKPFLELINWLYPQYNVFNIQEFINKNIDDIDDIYNKKNTNKFNEINDECNPSQENNTPNTLQEEDNKETNTNTQQEDNTTITKIEEENIVEIELKEF